MIYIRGFRVGQRTFHLYLNTSDDATYLIEGHDVKFTFTADSLALHAKGLYVDGEITRLAIGKHVGNVHLVEYEPRMTWQYRELEKTAEHIIVRDIYDAEAMACIVMIKRGDIE